MRAPSGKQGVVLPQPTPAPPGSVPTWDGLVPLVTLGAILYAVVFALSLLRVGVELARYFLAQRRRIAQAREPLSSKKPHRSTFFAGGDKSSVLESERSLRSSTIDADSASEARIAQQKHMRLSSPYFAQLLRWGHNARLNAQNAYRSHKFELSILAFTCGWAMTGLYIAGTYLEKLPKWHMATHITLATVLFIDLFLRLLISDSPLRFALRLRTVFEVFGLASAVSARGVQTQNFTYFVSYGAYQQFLTIQRRLFVNYSATRLLVLRALMRLIVLVVMLASTIALIETLGPLDASKAVGTIEWFDMMYSWSWFNAFWFIVVTITTVGYGDIVPDTALGRAFIVFSILAGVFLFGIIAHEVHALSERSDGSGSFRKRPGAAHVVLCGSRLDLATIRSFAMEFYSDERSAGVHLVVLTPNAQWSRAEWLAFVGRERLSQTEMRISFCRGSISNDLDYSRVLGESAQAFYVFSALPQFSSASHAASFSHRGAMTSNAAQSDADAVLLILSIRSRSGTVPIFAQMLLGSSRLQASYASRPVGAPRKARAAKSANFQFAKSWLNSDSASRSVDKEISGMSNNTDEHLSTQNSTSSCESGENFYDTVRHGITRKLNLDRSGVFSFAIQSSLHAIAQHSSSVVCLFEFQSVLMAESIRTNGFSALIGNLFTQNLPDSRISAAVPLGFSESSASIAHDTAAEHAGGTLLRHQSYGTRDNEVPPWLREYLLGSLCLLKSVSISGTSRAFEQDAVDFSSASTLLRMHDAGMIPLGWKSAKGDAELEAAGEFQIFDLTAPVTLHRGDELFVVTYLDDDVLQSALNAVFHHALTDATGKIDEPEAFAEDKSGDADTKSAALQNRDRTRSVRFAESAASGSPNVRGLRPSRKRERTNDGNIDENDGSAEIFYEESCIQPLLHVDDLFQKRRSSSFYPIRHMERCLSPVFDGNGVLDVTYVDNSFDFGLIPQDLKAHVIVCVDSVNQLDVFEQFLFALWRTERHRDRRVPVLLLSNNVPQSQLAKYSNQELPSVSQLRQSPDGARVPSKQPPSCGHLRAHGGCLYVLCDQPHSSPSAWHQARLGSARSVVILNSSTGMSSHSQKGASNVALGGEALRGSSKGGSQDDSADAMTLFTLLTLDTLTDEFSDLFICSELVSVSSLRYLSMCLHPRRRLASLGDSAPIDAVSLRKHSDRELLSGTGAALARNRVASFPRGLQSAPEFRSRQDAAGGGVMEMFTKRMGAGGSRGWDDSIATFAAGELVVRWTVQALLVRALREPGLTAFVSSMLGIISLASAANLKTTSPTFSPRSVDCNVRKPGNTHQKGSGASASATTSFSRVRLLSVPKEWLFANASPNENPNVRSFRSLFEFMLARGFVALGLYRSGDAVVRTPREPCSRARRSAPLLQAAAEVGGVLAAPRNRSDSSFWAFASARGAGRARASSLVEEDENFAEIGNSGEFGVDGWSHDYEFPADTEAKCVKLCFDEFGVAGNALPYVFTFPEPYTLVSERDGVYVLIPP